jgi:hypothetical protein
MKTIAILAAILAVSAAATAHAEPMPQFHQPGSPIKQGHYCWVYSSSNGAGWWDKCDSSRDPRSPRALSLRGLPRSEIEAVMIGGGDGGSGGSGGGGR